MQIIPVIDLKNGVVVHAKHGDREHYQPVQSDLCASADVFDVLAAFLELYDFDTFYIADLDAITQQGHHDRLIAELLAYFPKKMFWIDRGFQKYDASQLVDNSLPVLGSESYQEETVNELLAFNNRFVLSLDYRAEQALGANSLFINPKLWPEKIIIMTLARVGSKLGPDLNRLGNFVNRYSDKQFIAAGGVRSQADLFALQNIGIQQVLLATALHTGAIERASIIALQPT